MLFCAYSLTDTSTPVDPDPVSSTPEADPKEGAKTAAPADSAPAGQTDDGGKAGTNSQTNKGKQPRKNPPAKSLAKGKEGEVDFTVHTPAGFTKVCP